jgi:hypothetical protein
MFYHPKSSPIWVQFSKEWPLKIDPIIVEIVYWSRPRLMSNYISYPNCNNVWFFSAKWKRCSYNIIKLDDLSCFKKIHLRHTRIQVQSITKHNHFFSTISKHIKMRHHNHIIWVTFKHEKDETPFRLIGFQQHKTNYRKYYYAIIIWYKYR